MKFRSIAFLLVLAGGLGACNGDGGSGGGGDGSKKTSIWMNVVPPGANGNSAGAGGQGQNHPPNFTDQLFLYEELAFAPEGLKAADAEGNCKPPDNTAEHAANDRSIACSHFKPAYLTPTTVASTTTVTNPGTGNVVTITRDGWGVPFVTGATRADGMFGLGYVGAQDRLFLHDLLRNVGRGRMSEFLGPFDDAYDQDKSVLGDAGYSEDELDSVVQATVDNFGSNDGQLGKQVLDDLDNLVAGINGYIAFIQGPGAAEFPPEYGALIPAVDGDGNPRPRPWTRNDIVASAVLIQSTFAFGGGGEAGNLLTLQALDPSLSDSQRTPAESACEYWRDVRHANDPDTPHTDPANKVGARQSPAVIPEDCGAAWPDGHASLPAGVAIWDSGSYDPFGSDEFLQHQPGPPILAASKSTVNSKPKPADATSGQGVAQRRAGTQDALAKIIAASNLVRAKAAAVKPGQKLKVSETEIASAMDAVGTTTEDPYTGAMFGRKAMSNFIGVPASQTKDGYPIAVAGPQAGYFLSQLLWEVSVVTDDAGPGQLGFAGRGIVFADLPYINIGRGIDFTFSATSGSSDLVDTRVSKACLLAGTPLDTALVGAPSQADGFNNSTGAAGADGYPDINGYLFDHDPSDGFDPECRPIFFRTDTWKAVPTIASGASGGDPISEDVTYRTWRTHYGHVLGTALLGGEVVVVSKQRSTFFADLDTAPPFALATTYAIASPEDFFDIFNGTTGTFNWLYSDRDHIAWFHSGLYPTRHPDQHPELPVWGDGRYEWKGTAIEPSVFAQINQDPGKDGNDDVADGSYPSLIKVRHVGSKPLDGKYEWDGFLTRDDHPRAIDPSSGFLHSWNNNPAVGWWAADGKNDYGPIHRANMLRDRMQAFKDAGRKHTIATMVEIMGDGAHTDLRGFKVIPKMLDIVRTTSQVDLDALALAEIPDLAALEQIIDFLDQWAEDGSMDWIVPERGGVAAENSGLGGYRRGPRGDTSGSAREDGDDPVGFVYDYRSQVAFSDVLYPLLANHSLQQVRERPANVGVQGFHDDMAQGSAFQSGWYQFMDRVFGQALDEELGLDGTADEYVAGTYKQLHCGADVADNAVLDLSPTFAECRASILRALNESLVCLGGFGGNADWDGSIVSSNSGACQTGQSVVEQRDSTTHTAVSTQTVEPMHWTNRPTYQHAVQIKHRRGDEGLR